MPWLVRAWCEIWAPIGYLSLITGKILLSYLTPRSATSKSSATSQCAIKFFGSERHVKKDSTFFFTQRWNRFFCNFRREISPLRVSKKYLRWYRRSRRIEWYPSTPLSFLAGQYLQTNSLRGREKNTSSTCHSERRKTKREGRHLAILWLQKQDGERFI